MVCLEKQKKIHLIEEILKIEDAQLLAEVEHVIAKAKLYKVGRRSFASFSNLWTEEEIDELEKIIAEGCEQINPDDWK